MWRFAVVLVALCAARGDDDLCETYDGQPATCIDGFRASVCCYCNATGVCRAFSLSDDTPDTQRCGDAYDAVWTCDDDARRRERRDTSIALGVLFGAIPVIVILVVVIVCVARRQCRKRDKANRKTATVASSAHTVCFSLF